MDTSSVFLCKLFCTISVLFCCGVFNYALADEIQSGGISTGGISTGGISTGGISTGGTSTGGISTGGTSTGGISTGGESTGGATGSATGSNTPSNHESTSGSVTVADNLKFVTTYSQKLCSDGYYLSRCGSKEIGINWLKGMGNQDDYYSYDSSSDITNITNLRKFFAGYEPISYIPQNQTNAETVLPEVYKKVRNQILAKFCLDETGELGDLECKKCPNDAKISESTVGYSSFNNENEIVEDSWRIHTILDCYMDKFSDNTGTYVYIPNAATTSSNAAQKCYYSTAVAGSDLR